MNACNLSPEPAFRGIPRSSCARRPIVRGFDRARECPRPLRYIGRRRQLAAQTRLGAVPFHRFHLIRPLTSTMIVLRGSMILLRTDSCERQGFSRLSRLLPVKNGAVLVNANATNPALITCPDSSLHRLQDSVSKANCIRSEFERGALSFLDIKREAIKILCEF